MPLFKYSDVVKKLLNADSDECVALDLGASYIKGLYVASGKVKSYFVEKNKGQGIKAAAKWLKTENLLSKETRLAVKGPDTLVRYIAFPKVDKKNLKEAFSYEIAKYIPFSREEVYFDVAILDENYNVNEFFLMLAVVKKDRMDSLITACNNEKINLTEINLNSVPLMNLFLKANAQNSPDGQNAALVDVGFSSTLLTLLKKGVPCLSREIKVSSGGFIQKVSKVKNFTPEQSDDFVSKLNVPKESLEREEVQEMLEMIEETAYELAEEIKNSLDYFEVNFGQRIQTIYLTGGLSKISGIERLMSHSLDISVKVWDPFEGVDLSEGKDISVYKEMFAVALGLAL